MTPEQIRLVRNSFALVLPVAPKAAEMFYARLFAIAPEVRPLFRSDMAAQGRKLMLMLTTVVADLDRPDRLLPAAVELARRHVGYGARDAHYVLVGRALIDTMREALGPAFDQQTEAAWAAAYATLSGAMIAGARRAA